VINIVQDTPDILLYFCGTENHILGGLQFWKAFTQWPLLVIAGVKVSL